MSVSVYEIRASCWPQRIHPWIPLAYPYCLRDPVSAKGVLGLQKACHTHLHLFRMWFILWEFHECIRHIMSPPTPASTSFVHWAISPGLPYLFKQRNLCKHLWKPYFRPLNGPSQLTPKGKNVSECASNHQVLRIARPHWSSIFFKKNKNKNRKQIVMCRENAASQLLSAILLLSGLLLRAPF